MVAAYEQSTSEKQATENVLILDCGCEVEVDDNDRGDYCGDCGCCEEHCFCGENCSWEDELYAQAAEYDSPHVVIYRN